ncbi:SOUL family heme-binding protein [Cryobacterium breve]|uniref:SOUL family heme-binding protein n=1 Tax=Cryobacterium breve TaxID=1259258 RepID=UPI0032B1D103
MTEQQPYAVVGDYDGFELRSYPEHLVAEVTTTGPFEDAGNRAFRYLFAYISGENSVRQKVAMTAPVVQAEASTKIAMTAPVVQEALGGKPGDRDGKGMFRVAFVLPAGLTIDTAPQPTSQEVRLRSVPGSSTAAVRYRGRWDEAGYARHLETLRGRSPPLDSRRGESPVSPASIHRSCPRSCVETRSCSMSCPPRWKLDRDPVGHVEGIQDDVPLGAEGIRRAASGTPAHPRQPLAGSLPTP